MRLVNLTKLYTKGSKVKEYVLDLKKGDNSMIYQVPAGRSLHGSQRVQHQTDVGSAEESLDTFILDAGLL